VIRLLVGVALFLTPLCACAEESDVEQKPTTVQPSQPLPGEEVDTASGKKMKVWTTTGPVPVNPPTYDNGHGSDLDDVDVIVAPPLRRDRVNQGDRR
jgi:hypothetical protein